MPNQKHAFASQERRARSILRSSRISARLRHRLRPNSPDRLRNSCSKQMVVIILFVNGRSAYNLDFLECQRNWLKFVSYHS